MAPNLWREGLVNIGIAHIAEAFGCDSKTVVKYRRSQPAIDGCRRVKEWKVRNRTTAPSLNLIRDGIEMLQDHPNYQRYVDYIAILVDIVSESRDFWSLEADDSVLHEHVLDAHRMFTCFLRTRQKLGAGKSQTLPRAPTSTARRVHRGVTSGTQNSDCLHNSSIASKILKNPTTQMCLFPRRQLSLNTLEKHIDRVSTSAVPRRDLPPIILQVLWSNPPAGVSSIRSCRDTESMIPDWGSFLAWLNNQYGLESIGLKVLACKASTKTGDDHLREFVLKNYDINSDDTWANAITVASRELSLMVMFTSTAINPRPEIDGNWGSMRESSGNRLVAMVE